MKKAIIIGSEGQDGRIAYDLLVARGYGVLGFGRNTVRNSRISWDKPVDITDKEQVGDLVNFLQADEVYYLAACHQSSEDRIRENADLVRESYEVNVFGLVNFLEGIRKYSVNTKLFYACSALIFEGTKTLQQDENTPFCPRSIYGITKLDGLLLCRFYRSNYGIFACSGIFYNHESAYRRENFISKKIIKAAVNIKQGKQDSLTVGDLSAEIDWGYAPDYVEAMQRIMAVGKPEDFIIASGQMHTVRDFVEAAFDQLGLDWKKYVKEDAALMTRKRKTLVGNPGKLKTLTGWKPTVDFREMIKLLLDAQKEGACV